MAYEQVQKPSSSFVPVKKKVSEFAPSASRVQAKDVTAGEQEQMPKVSTPATDANWLMKHPLFKGNQFLQREVAPASESESVESEEETLQRQEAGNESATPHSITVQAKLTIGEPGDKYEQEADRVASQVVKQINSPEAASSSQGQSVQRMEEPVEELQAKPSISDLQRTPLPLEVQREAMPEGEELQAKSILQRREAIAVGDASTDLDTAINSARGGGQPLDAGLQRSMGQAMGADFSGVRVHTDAQSDQLNQSIQAKAFTTGQDVFFRQGAYEPGSRGGQELIAHELTHVVQQNGGAVQRSQPQERREGLQAATSLEGEGAIQCFVPTDVEQPQVETALNTLLGADKDPGGIRAQLTTNASSLGDLHSAIMTVVTTAAVPEGNRVGLLNQVGNDVKLLADLLKEATQVNGAGTPGERLSRVLAANPAVPRTLTDLKPKIEAQKEIDDKILRGKITGGALAANEKPSAEKRNLIGGHSPEILTDPSYVIESNVLNPNNTRYIGFRKLLRSDAGAFATAVSTNAPNNLVVTISTVANGAKTAADAAPKPPKPVPKKAVTPEIQKKIDDQYSQKLSKWTIVNHAHTLVANHVNNATLTSVNAAAHPNSAADLKPFIDAVSDLYASANAVIKAASEIDSAAVAPYIIALQTAMDSFESTGPVLSAKKNSTVAPDGWTDDQVLRAGDQTAQVPPTLIRQDSTDNNPVDGSIVETKHQLVINGIVWVVMKEGVTFHAGHPPTFSGGRTISSYPTTESVIPPDALHPSKDADRFSTVR